MIVIRGLAYELISRLPGIFRRLAVAVQPGCLVHGVRLFTPLAQGFREVRGCQELRSKVSSSTGYPCAHLLLNTAVAPVDDPGVPFLEFASCDLDDIDGKLFATFDQCLHPRVQTCLGNGHD